MAQEAGNINPTRFTFQVPEDTGGNGFLVAVARSIARELGCDLVSIAIQQGDTVDLVQATASGVAARNVDGALFQLEQGVISFNGTPWSVPLIINDIQRARVPGELALALNVRKVRSCGVFPLLHEGRQFGLVECLFTRSFHRWRKEEVEAFKELSQQLSARYGGEASEQTPARGTAIEESRGQYRRLARYGNIVILVTDSEFRISEVFGDTEKLLGVPASGMKRRSDLWDIIIDPRDRGRLRRRIMRLRIEHDELREEVRVVHQRTGEVRWMMLRALPQVSPQGVFIGWEGFGLDITDRRRSQEALLGQNKRLEALFEVARALQGLSDPAAVMLKAIAAIVRATSSHCGYAAQLNRDSGELEVAAGAGFGEEYYSLMRPVLAGPSLLRSCVDAKVGCKVEDMQNDPRAASALAKREGLKSAIIMPLLSDAECYGAIVVFKRDAGAYTDVDFELLSAAAAQIALAVRQAERFDSERRHGEALKALYRLSSELAKYRSAQEIAENAFPILQQEFSLKRGWFGVLNEQGTHLVGKGGFGPGVRRRLQEVQVELRLQHDVIDEAFRTQRPVVWSRGRTLECSGLNGVIERLKLESFVVVPLVSLGKTAGVMVLEPLLAGTFYGQGRLQLLVGMANEIATVLTARRFEDRMAESLKMRMAGLLAGGVAHNFNNLLQAILGQIALVEMQAPKNPAVKESTRMITDAAKRGASLVAQLLSFSSQAPVRKEVFSLEKLLSDSRELYESLLGKRIELRIIPCDDLTDVYGDASQVQQVITNLLANAKDAVSASDRPAVSLSTSRVKLRTGEVDPDLAPGIYVRLDIRDNGVGLDDEVMARCFEPFFTTKNVDHGSGVGISGSGLGLSAAYSIVKQHAGLITVHSVSGAGATFSVYLPAGLTPETAGPDAFKEPQSDQLDVLMLGWEAGVKPYVASIVESLGHRSRSAYDIRQLEELLHEDSQRWSRVVVDLDATGEGGVQNCQKLLTQYPELCIVGATSDREGSAARVVQGERFIVLEKPLSVWSVERAFKRLKTA
jgi:PAS domain S-box-containing protein